MARFFPAAIALLLLPMTLPAVPVSFYVGTYTHTGKSQGIYRGTLDTATGAMGPLTLAAEIDDPSFLAISADGRFLYAASEKGSGGSITAFSLGAGGALVPLNSQPAGGGGTCHVSVDTAGKWVYAANYGGGSIAAFPAAADGSLGERAAFVPFSGSGPNPKRQDKPHAHSIYAVDKVVYACDLGTDQVRFFHADDKLGIGAPFGSLRVPPGAGPRHLAFAPGGQTAYAVNEMGLSLTPFSPPSSAGNGGLVEHPTIPLLPDDADAPQGAAAEVVVHPSRRWLYASVRNPDVITVCALDSEGTPTRLDTVPARVKTPRSIAIDPTGQWLLAAGQDSDTLALFKIDGASGKLSPVGEPVAAGAPVCVAFTPR